MATKCSISVPNQLPKLMAVCEEWGSFRLINHHQVLPSSLMTEMKSVVRSLFDLPVEIKRWNLDVIAGSGYVAPTATNPLYEALGLYDMASRRDVKTVCSQLNATPHQREVITKYVGAVRELFIRIGEKLTDGLGVKREVVAFENWSGQFRINKYHFTRESVGCSGVQIHTDSGFLTILQDDDGVGGLEVIDKSGHFTVVEPCPNTVFVNLGDLAKVWSNGRLHNVKHRVQCNEATIRVSVATFLVGPREGIEHWQNLWMLIIHVYTHAPLIQTTGSCNSPQVCILAKLYSYFTHRAPKTNEPGAILVRPSRQPKTDLPNQLMAACDEWGCFRLINIHEVLPSLLMTEMKSVVRSLFDLPVKIKS